MRLTPPKNITFWIAVALAVAGLLGYLKTVAAFTPYAFWLVFAGFVLLALAVLVENL
jgi:hypothetical protein